METGRHVADIEVRLNEVMTDVESWSGTESLGLAPAKSSIILFTSDTHEGQRHPQVGEVIPLSKELRILGVTFDTFINFAAHVAALLVKGRSRFQIMQMLAGTSWGASKETLILPFKMLMKPLFTYCCPIWFPNCSTSSIKKLQVLQNSALRLVLGCHKIAHEDHLHSEAKVLPVLEHLSMLSAQFLCSALRSVHPSFSVVSADSGPRDIKVTLASRYLPFVEEYLVDGSMPLEGYKAAVKDVHTKVVEMCLDGYAPNAVLGCKPPEVNSSEQRLLRHHRTTLSQLRSGWCRALNSYQHRINLVNSDQCPLCNLAYHSVEHLFNCKEAPTDLCVLDLWLRPIRAMRFLLALPFFDYLPPLEPIPIPPPPEPPP